MANIPDHFLEEQNTFIRLNDDVDYFKKILKEKFPLKSSKHSSYNLDACNEAKEYNFYHQKRGYALIFNITDVDGLSERKGSDVDATNIFNRFKSLEFNVKIFKNCRVNDMLDILEHFSLLDHKDEDCFVCFVLSHGAQDLVMGYRGNIIHLDDLAEPIKKCKSLLGKPKIFIVQACRGQELDPGHTIVADGLCTSKQMVVNDNAASLIPNDEDFLWAYASPPGYSAWRNQAEGSWFIRALVQAIDLYGQSKNFLHVLTLANYYCIQFESGNTGSPEIKGKKQCSNYCSRLTKDIFFRPKEDTQN